MYDNEPVRYGIDRIYRVLPGTILSFVEIGSWANPAKKYSNLDLRYPIYILHYSIIRLKTHLTYNQNPVETCHKL